MYNFLLVFLTAFLVYAFVVDLNLGTILSISMMLGALIMMNYQKHFLD